MLPAARLYYKVISIGVSSKPAVSKHPPYFALISSGELTLNDFASIGMLVFD